MADKTILAQMLEHLVNDEQQKAEELFHEYVVAQSREIYESLIESEIEDEEEDETSETDDEDQVDEASHADDEDEDEDDEDVEEDFSLEADDAMGGDPTDDLEGDLDAEMGDDDDMGDDDMGDKEPSELFQDLEAIVDELQAKFDDMGGGDDMGDEGDMDMDDMGDDEEVKDSFDDELATVREYVEKIGAKMGDNGANTKSTVAGKNDMGGTTANIVSGGTSETGGTKGGLAAPSTKEDNAGNVNVPGGKAGVKHLGKEPGHGAEKKATGDNGDKSAQSLFRGRR